MEKIFYAHISTFPSSEEAVIHILRHHFGVHTPKISRTENGKPYLDASHRLFFSISHTKSQLFIAFSDENVGIDAEEDTRPFPSKPLLSKFSIEERSEIQTAHDFLRHWTVKESAVKWLDGTLAHDLKKLSYYKEKLYYSGVKLPIHITTKQIEGHVLSVCCKRDFTNTDVISL